MSMLRAHFVPSFGVLYSHGRSLFQTENALQLFKGEKVLYTCDVTVSQSKGLGISAECSVNSGCMGEQRLSPLCFQPQRDGYLPQKDS